MTKLEKKYNKRRICTSGSLDGLAEMLRQYWYDELPGTFEEYAPNHWHPVKATGRKLEHVIVVKSGKRFYALQ